MAKARAVIPKRRFAFDPGKTPQEGGPTCERSLSWTSVVQGVGRRQLCA